MSDAALQQIQSGLAGAQAALLRGELQDMHDHLLLAIDALAEVTRAGFVPQQERQSVPWDEARATQLVWDLLARFKAADCHVFPFAGTLLGLEREGRLLRNDKDADFGVWLEDFSLAGRLLQQWGLRRATDTPPFANMATYVDAATGYSIDLFGLRRDAANQRTEGGVWLYGKPPSYQRVLHFPWFELADRNGAWWPDPPGVLLEALYGDWRTPRPEWDSLISNVSVRDLNLNWHCWALRSLCTSWLGGDLAKTRRLLQQILDRAGDIAPYAAWRDALDEP